jgi:dienelactone hydrolase
MVGPLHSTPSNEKRISSKRIAIGRRLGLLLAVVAANFAAVTCRAQEVPTSQDVDLTAADGVKLKASYFPAAKPGPGVLLLHQCNQQRKNWDALATQLAASGIHVLTLDFRGFGESGGTPVKDLPQADFARIMAEKWPGDVDAAFNYLLSRPGVTRGVAGAGGASCGVNQSIQVARRHPEQVKSLVLLSGTTDRDGREFLRKSEKLPILLSAADDDGAAVELMQWLYGLSTNPGSKFDRYPSGGHGTEMFAAHRELPGVIVDWYVQTLIKTPGRAPAMRAAARPAHSPGILELIDSPGGALKAAQQLAEAQKHDPKAKLFSEGIVNGLGYEHLQAGDTKGALEILKLNVTAFPNSPNVYDSLSDAYLADGQKDAARENAKRALQLLASDSTDPEPLRKAIQESAEGKLKQLAAGPQ